MDLAGEIKRVGEDINRFKKGDQVFGATGFFRIGVCAENICLPEQPEAGEVALALKPSNMTYAEAAAVPVGEVEALCFLIQRSIRSGQKVLINGAAGTISTFAVQLANYFVAEVTAVDSTGKLGLLSSIAADLVIDYTQEDFAISDESYDLIIDLVSKSSFSGSIRALEQNGRYLLANPGLLQLVRGRWTSMTSSKKVIFGAAHAESKDLIYLKELVEVGKLISVIDRYYILEQTADAHRYVEQGHNIGNAVITLIPD